MYQLCSILFFLAFLSSQDKTFSDYWYKGKAEISSFELDQARYGEVHKGTAVLIFVTEDFSKSKQVKLDYPAKYPKDAVNVLKLNNNRKFLTGIYPYSMMTSVFTPVKSEIYGRSVKITASSQEWCGHTFLQLNKKDENYQYKQFSYFESESDQDGTIESDFLEDELWTFIRLSPQKLPKGDYFLMPSTFYIRLRHLGIQAYLATLELMEEEKVYEYHIRYKEIKRNLKITFNKTFPYDIVSWEETYESGWGKKKKVLTTTAKRIKMKMIDYWTKNKLVDRHLYYELGLY